jgi:hypothetical protein
MSHEGDLALPIPSLEGVPHLSRLLRKVGTTDAFSAAVDVDVVFAPVERTLLSAAFDPDLDVDFVFGWRSASSAAIKSQGFETSAAPKADPPWKRGASAPRRDYPM